MFRIPPCYLSNFLQIDFDGAVGDELNIVEAHHAPTLPVDRRVARTYIRNRRTNRLPAPPTPACIERPHDLLATVRRRSRCQPKRVKAWNTAEYGFECRLNFRHVEPPATRRYR